LCNGSFQVSPTVGQAQGFCFCGLLTGFALIHFGIASLRQAPPLATVVLQIIGIGAGILLLVGLWTPLTGALAAIVNVSIAFSRCCSHSDDPWIPIMLAALGAALAMVGLGAWSIDAFLFGRKRIEIPEL